MVVPFTHLERERELASRTRRRSCRVALMVAFRQQPFAKTQRFHGRALGEPAGIPAAAQGLPV